MVHSMIDRNAANGFACYNVATIHSAICIISKWLVVTWPNDFLINATGRECSSLCLIS